MQVKIVMDDSKKEFIGLITETPNVVMPNKPHSYPTDESILRDARTVHYRRGDGKISYNSLDEVPDHIMKSVFEDWKNHFPCWYIDDLKDERAIRIAKKMGLTTEAGNC